MGIEIVCRQNYIEGKYFMNRILLFLFCFITSRAMSQNEMTADQNQVKQLSVDWMQATMQRDEKALNRIVAPEFKLAGTDISRPGITRDVWMKNTLENLKIDSSNYIRMNVEIVDHVAIVRSTFYWSVSFRDSPAKKDTVDLVDTWIKRNNAWQVVSRLVVDK